MPTPEPTEPNPAVEQIGRVFLGGNERTEKARVELCIPMFSSTSIAYDPPKPQPLLGGNSGGLLLVGGCQLIGGPHEFAVVRAAAEALVNHFQDAQREREKEAADLQHEPRLCRYCEEIHAPTESCPSVTDDQSRGPRERAYQIVKRSWLVSMTTSRLVVDTVALWLEAGDPASARLLLHLWLDSTLANTVLRILQEEKDDR